MRGNGVDTVVVAGPSCRASSRTGPTTVELDRALKQIAGYPPLVFAGEARSLQASLAAGRRRQRVPAPGRRLRRELRGVLRRQHPGEAARHPADGGRAHVLAGRAGREGRAHRRPVRQAPVVSPTERVGDVDLPSFRGHIVNGPAPDRRGPGARPRPPRAGVPPVGVDAEPAAGVHQGRVRRPRPRPRLDPGVRRVQPRGPRYEQLAAEIDRALRFMRACGDRHRVERRPPRGRRLHQPRGAACSATRRRSPARTR